MAGRKQARSRVAARRDGAIAVLDGTAAVGEAFLHGTAHYLAPGEEYGLPSALRMTIGTEEGNLAVLEALEAFIGAEGSSVP